MTRALHLILAMILILGFAAALPGCFREAGDDDDNDDSADDDAQQDDDNDDSADDDQQDDDADDDQTDDDQTDDDTDDDESWCDDFDSYDGPTDPDFLASWEQSNVLIDFSGGDTLFESGTLVLRAFGESDEEAVEWHSIATVPYGSGVEATCTLAQDFTTGGGFPTPDAIAMVALIGSGTQGYRIHYSKDYNRFEIGSVPGGTIHECPANLQETAYNYEFVVADSSGGQTITLLLNGAVVCTTEDAQALLSGDVSVYVAAQAYYHVGNGVEATFDDLCIDTYAGTADCIDNGDGTVTCGPLMWTKNDNGSNVNYAQAKAWAESSRFGYDDWRLPTREELASLHDPDRHMSNGCVTDLHIREPFVHSCSFTWSGESCTYAAASGYYLVGWTQSDSAEVQCADPSYAAYRRAMAVRRID